MKFLLLTLGILIPALAQTSTSGKVAIQGTTHTSSVQPVLPFNILTLTTVNSLAPSTTPFPGFPTVTGGNPAEGYQGGTYYNGIAYFEPWQYNVSQPHGTILAYTGGPSGTFHCTTSITCASNWKYFDMTALTPFVPAGYTATGAAATGYTCQGVMDQNGNYYQIPGFVQQHPVMMRINLGGSGGITNAANYSYFSVPDHGSNGNSSPIDGGYNGPRGWCTAIFDGKNIIFAPTNGGNSGTNSNVLRFDTTAAGGFVIGNFDHFDISTVSAGAGGFLSSAYDGYQNAFFLPSSGSMAVYNTMYGGTKDAQFKNPLAWKFLSFANLGTPGYPQVTGSGNLDAVQHIANYVGGQMVWDPAGVNEYLYMAPFASTTCGTTNGCKLMLSDVIRVKVGTCSPGIPNTQTCTGTFAALDITASSSTWEIFDLANLTTNSAWAAGGFTYPPLYPASSPLANQLTLGGFQLTWLNVHTPSDPIVGFVADYGNFLMRHHASHSLSDPSGWDVAARPVGQANGCMGGGYDPVNQLLYISCPGVSPVASAWMVGPL